GPARQRRGGAVRRQGDQFDAAGDGRDRAAARLADGIQRQARHHADLGEVGHRDGDRAGDRSAEADAGGGGAGRERGGQAGADRGVPRQDAGGGGEPEVRGGGAVAGHDRQGAGAGRGGAAADGQEEAEQAEVRGWRIASRAVGRR